MRTGPYSKRIPSSKEQLQQRLKRLRGQVSGIDKMLEDKRYCVDILLQVSAVRAALDQIGLFVLTRHLGHGLEGTTCQGPAQKYLTKDEQLEELRVAVSGLLGQTVAETLTSSSVKEEI